MQRVEVPVYVGPEEYHGNCLLVVHQGGPAATRGDEASVRVTAEMVATLPRLLGYLLEKLSEADADAPHCGCDAEGRCTGHAAEDELVRLGYLPRR